MYAKQAIARFRIRAYPGFLICEFPGTQQPLSKSLHLFTVLRADIRSHVQPALLRIHKELAHVAQHNALTSLKPYRSPVRDPRFTYARSHGTSTRRNSSPRGFRSPRHLSRTSSTVSAMVIRSASATHPTSVNPFPATAPQYLSSHSLSTKSTPFPPPPPPRAQEPYSVIQRGSKKPPDGLIARISSHCATASILTNLRKEPCRLEPRANGAKKCGKFSILIVAEG
ncbi:hypothetical protein BJ742DRAFT_773674 [Cladochytrium replicatum]|nr:hypothetical protein BJ742DRAFT_773674 [Cladochytrium replicatum]